MQQNFKSMPHSEEEQNLRSIIQSGYRYALSLTHHRQDAEDIIQQACLKILRKRNSLVSKSYLFTTVRHLYIDSRRRPSTSDARCSSIELAVDGSKNHVEQFELQMDVEQLLGGLRPEEREALYLNCVEGYTAAEIASLTGQPRGTVLSHLSRAKKRAQQQAKMETQ